MSDGMEFKKQLVFFLFFCCYAGSYSLSHAKSPGESPLVNETSVLLSIKASLIDPLNQLGDWRLPNNGTGNSPAHCNWSGVWCDSINGAVEKLDISHKNLSGEIPDEIQKLQGLTSLNLSCNEFSGKLPKSLSNLTELKIIDLSQNFFADEFPVGLGKLPRLTKLNASSNSFSGDIPEDLGNATPLESLDLRGNFFQGSIPKSLKNLGKLRFLGLSGNNLTGQLPPELGQLSSLETMVLGYNQFEGEIPQQFGNLTSLRYLDLAIGNLGGAIPSDLGRLKLLNTIFLYKNSFEGTIPKEIGNITSLQVLDLSDNVLTGEVPAEMAQLKNLQVLNLICNQLTGPVPSGFGELTQLEVLELWNNSFSGPLPSDLGRNSPLQWLDISSNAFSGQIPAALCGGGNLTKVILFNNALSGPIPPQLSTCDSLIRVRMRNNLLSGAIPVGFGKLGRLQRLELANNRLNGQVPNDIAASTSLSFIDFSKNKLQSTLPPSILSIPNLQTFMASDNNLEGEIPDQFQDCPSLLALDLSSNHFTGTIPASIASCVKLVTLNLRNNGLTGPIPKAISTMPTLAVLDLSNNYLTGSVPETLGTSPALETLNISHNKLEGPVPTNGILRTINPDDLIGNSGLCSGVLLPCSENQSHSLRKFHSKNIVAIWVIAILSLLAIVLAGFGARSLYKKWYFQEMGKNEWPWRLILFQRLNFTSNDILACIKDSNVIGMGATGIVYKMERANDVVAVKKLWRRGLDIEIGNSNDLIGEVNLLGRLRHRNIVKLLGFLHNRTSAMIIYEYMKNGSLGEVLHGKERGRLLVDWVLRYNIAVGVAQGLTYLHHDCHPPVIHRDVKSNNILLDGNLEARIADFGLARMMMKPNETVSAVAGSYGYIAPEYGYTLKVDEKSDIYSYGVVLMELLTGKRPLDPEFGDSVDIVEWTRRKIRENKALEEEVLDPNAGNCGHVQEEMLFVLRIALLCTAKLPKDRPSMRDVITMLEEAKPRRKSSSSIGGQNLGDKNMPIFSPSPVNGLL